ncbi:hypothetical protein BDR07DRAFT_586910 [Suillus spraguei]|nr:hypothetical protein BDR07DRAFT_680758 [Suillus spraguei]KAG2354808.1 hypothetical protein BDR07DRAFT_586910 [Suillus spraguei]
MIYNYSDDRRSVHVMCMSFHSLRPCKSSWTAIYSHTHWTAAAMKMSHQINIIQMKCTLN